jgi:hypothetical protein
MKIGTVATGCGRKVMLLYVRCGVRSSLFVVNVMLFRHIVGVEKLVVGSAAPL